MISEKGPSFLVTQVVYILSSRKWQNRLIFLQFQVLRPQNYSPATTLSFIMSDICFIALLFHLWDLGEPI